ncbi:MAG: ABC transporter ATP-binding protein, partial [Candidatus Acidiferrum sp.]
MARHRSGSRTDNNDLPKSPINFKTMSEAARLARYLAPYKLTYIFAIVALSISSVLGLAFPAVAGSLINGA